MEGQALGQVKVSTRGDSTRSADLIPVQTEAWVKTAPNHPFAWLLEAFHTRADSKLQWGIVIAIFKLPSVYTTEKILPSLGFSIPEQGEKAWLISVFFWHADCYFIWDRIYIRKCTVYRWKWIEGHLAPLPPPPKKKKKKNHNLEVKAFIRQFERCVTGKLLRISIWTAHFKLAFVMLICIHPGQNTVIRMTVTRMIIAHFCSCVKTLLYYLWKLTTLIRTPIIPRLHVIRC